MKFAQLRFNNAKMVALVFIVALMPMMLFACKSNTDQSQQEGKPKTSAPTDAELTAATDYVKMVNARRLRLRDPNELGMSVKSLEPSPVAGLFEVVFTIKYGVRTLYDKVLVDSSGQYLIDGDNFLNLSDNATGLSDPHEEPLPEGQLDLTGQPASGPKNAPVTITMFGDFQDGLTRQADILYERRLKTDFPDKLRLVYINAPLMDNLRPWSMRAAQIGECLYAKDENLFWSYLGLIFENHAKFEHQGGNFEELVREYLKQVGLNDAEINRCLNSDASAKAVAADIAMAEKLGVTVAPTLFINRIRQERLPRTYNDLKKLVEEALAEK